jgi:lipid-binding SYLF domain-containing protein
VEGGSFGAQIGGQESDVILLVMNKGAQDRLLTSEFTLGADASIAAGPVGRTAQAQTDAFLTAQILSYARSRGVFAGVSLQGSTLRDDDEANRQLYGRELTNKQIVQGSVPVPPAARPLIAELNKYSPRVKEEPAGV